MYLADDNPFRHQEDADKILFDPTDPNLLRTNSGAENPAHDYCGLVSGTRHPSLEDIVDYTGRPEPGAILLPATIPLLNQNSRDPLSREAVYGIDLVFQSSIRSTHTMVLGPTGAGKNTNVLDPLRHSAISDPTQSVITVSLKSSDYGPVQALCDATGKPLVVVNLNDAQLSFGIGLLESNAIR